MGSEHNEEYTIWTASDDHGGEVLFDTEPGLSEILNCCDDLQRPIEVHELTVRVIRRHLSFTVPDAFP